MWDKIKSYSGCSQVRVPGTDHVMYLVPIPGCPSSTSWLIGEYKVQTPFATKLRESKKLQEFLMEHGVRLGMRMTDVAPAVPRQLRYGKKIEAKQPKDYRSQRLLEQTKPVNGADDPVNRRTDRELNVRKFWETQTPQSHHIVEYNNLRDIGCSKPDAKGGGVMDHGQLPCVLLAAELHQRYISAILRALHGKKRQELINEIPSAYSSLYLSRGPLLHPLWDVSRAILERAGLKIS